MPLPQASSVNLLCNGMIGLNTAVGLSAISQLKRFRRFRDGSVGGPLRMPTLSDFMAPPPPRPPPPPPPVAHAGGMRRKLELGRPCGSRWLRGLRARSLFHPTSPNKGCSRSFSLGGLKPDTSRLRSWVCWACLRMRQTRFRRSLCVAWRSHVLSGACWFMGLLMVKVEVSNSPSGISST